MRCRKGMLNRFAREKSGDAAIEFALIAALFLVPLFFGIVEVSNFLSAERRVARLASTLADLVAQCEPVTECEQDAKDAMSLSAAILDPLPIDDEDLDDELLEIRISCVGDDGKVRWSEVRREGGDRLPALMDGAAFPEEIPDGLLQGGDVIVAEVSYLYRPRIVVLLAPYFWFDEEHYFHYFQFDEIHYNALRGDKCFPP